MQRLRRLANLLKRLARDKRGVSSLEYVTIGAGVAVFCIVAWTFLGDELSDMFTDISTGVTDSTETSDGSDSDDSDESSSDDDSDSDTNDDSDSDSDSGSDDDSGMA